MSGDATGITVPTGQPDALRQAAVLWDATAGALDDAGGAVDATTAGVAAADWHGDGSDAYAGAARVVSSTMRLSGTTLRDAADAARRFARDLHDAQDRARRAIRQAEDALDAIARAQAQSADAAGRLATAQGRAASATTTMAHASAAGPAGAPIVAGAQVDYDGAMNEAGSAAVDQRRAEAALAHAQEDLDRARTEGRAAGDDADAAARAASAAFSQAAGATPGQYLSTPPPVPVSLAGASPDLAALDPSILAPFARLGRPLKPGEVRAAQIARAGSEQIPNPLTPKPPRAPAAARASASARRPAAEGGMADRFGGEVEGLIGVPLFGDPSTKGYQRGRKLATAAALVPTPGMIARTGERGVLKVGEKTVVRVLENGVERQVVVTTTKELAAAYRAEARVGTRRLRNETLRVRERAAGLPEGSLTQPPGTVVHHVVPKGEYSQYGQEARDLLHRAQARLARAGVGPDDGMNGSFMPAGPHRAVHTGDYFLQLDRRLDEAGGDPVAVRQVLARIARELEQHGRLRP
jgi:HNH/ENDO VII superfamily nuclease